MTCSLCSRVALYISGKLGFCGEHREEAVRATVKEQHNTQSYMSVKKFFGRRKYAGNMATGGGSKKKYHDVSNSPVSGIDGWKAAQETKKFNGKRQTAATRGT